MANQIATFFNVGVVGDGLSLTIVVDLKNDPVQVNSSNPFSINLI